MQAAGRRCRVNQSAYCSTYSLQLTTIELLHGNCPLVRDTACQNIMQYLRMKSVIERSQSQWPIPVIPAMQPADIPPPQSATVGLHHGINPQATVVLFYWNPSDIRDQTI